MSTEGEYLMKKFTIIWAIATGMQGITLHATDNTEVYRKVGYSLIEKSALASTTILVTCAVAYGLWTWWNKEPQNIKPAHEKLKISNTKATQTFAKELAEAAQRKRAEIQKKKKEAAAKK
jgi:hypothetical protein